MATGGTSNLGRHQRYVASHPDHHRLQKEGTRPSCVRPRCQMILTHFVLALIFSTKSQLSGLLRLRGLSASTADVRGILPRAGAREAAGPANIRVLETCAGQQAGVAADTFKRSRSQQCSPPALRHDVPRHKKNS